MRLVRAVLFPAATIVLAPSISAQTLGLPITYRGVMTGFGSAIDVGLDPHGFRTFAGTGTVAIGRFAVAGATLPLFDVSATAAIVAGDASASGWSVGANAALLNSLQIGTGYTRTGSTTRLHIPLSAVLPVAACVDAQRALIVYGAPIWNFEHVSAQLGDRWEPSWSSFSAGVVLELPSGIGIQGGVGKPFHHAPDQTYDRWSFSIGVHISRHSIVHSTPSKDYGCHALV